MITIFLIGEHGCKTRNIFNKQLDTLCVGDPLVKGLNPTPNNKGAI